MIIIDQLGMVTDNLDSQVASFNTLGQLEWVRDTVEAVHLYVEESIQARLGGHYQAHLAFNEYFIPNGVTLEIMQLIHGMSWPMMRWPEHRFTHFGYHLTHDQADSGQPDSLLQECQMLQLMGLRIMQVSQTVAHKNTQRRYRIAYATGDLTGGVPIKVIQRLLPKSTVAQAQEGIKLFARLGHGR